MRRGLCLLLSFVLLACFVLPAFAAEEVPERVLKCVDSVVRILVEYHDGTSSGSGFIIKSDKDDTLIATNYHVVEGNPYRISVWVGADRKVNASIFAHSEQKDLCILKIESIINAKALVLSNAVAKQGEAVYAVGYPGAADILSDSEAHASTDATITNGIVSAIREVTVSKYGSPVRVLQINAAINQGNSGGPLFDKKGEVIGINTYGVTDAQGIFGAIDIAELRNFLEYNNIVLAHYENHVLIVIVIVAVVLLSLTACLIIVARKKNKKKSPNGQLHEMSLRQYMAIFPNGMDEKTAVALLLPVVLQLRDMHNNGKAHLEVSADSIIVSENGAYLMDASGIESSRFSSGFAAPEIYHDHDIGHQADIYSICAVFSYVLSGVLPKNALKRREDQIEEANGNLLKQMIICGMSLRINDRFTNVQDFILKLSQYVTKNFEELSVWQHTMKVEIEEDSAEISLAKAKKTTRQKCNILNSKGRVVACLAMSAILLLTATYLGIYFRTRTLAEVGEFTKANKLLAVRFLTNLHDPNLCAYITAGVNLETQKYDLAKAGFQALAGYRNADELALESDYRYAAQLVNESDFLGGVKLYRQLAKNGYKDSYEKIWNTHFRRAQYWLYEEKMFDSALIQFQTLADMNYDGADEMIKEVYYLWAEDHLCKEEYLEAYDKYYIIQEYFDVNDIMVELREAIYLEGIDRFAEKEYGKAAEAFSAVYPYKESRDYLIEACRKYVVENNYSLIEREARYALFMWDINSRCDIDFASIVFP